MAVFSLAGDVCDIEFATSSVLSVSAWRALALESPHLNLLVSLSSERGGAAVNVSLKSLALNPPGQPPAIHLSTG
jgi:hypothetical protein